MTRIKLIQPVTQTLETTVCCVEWTWKCLVCVWAGTHNDGQCVWEATDKREEACQKTRQAHTHTRTHPPQQLLLPHPPISALFIGAPLLLASPPNSPAKLTAPSSVENESRLHYNRAGQIPLALSEIERRE